MPLRAMPLLLLLLLLRCLFDAFSCRHAAAFAVDYLLRAPLLL